MDQPMTGQELTEVLERYFSAQTGDRPCVLTDWVVCVAVRDLETGATGIMSAPWGSKPTIIGLLDLAKEHHMHTAFGETDSE
jgi:hypothetical protein